MRIFIIAVICVLTFLAMTVTYAQPGDPGGGGTPGDVPITGIEILLAAGALFGIRSIIRRKGE